MIYDRRLYRCQLAAGAGSVTQHAVTVGAPLYYADLEVYHRRFWEAVAAGSRIDRMVELPLHRDFVAADLILLDDEHLYRIEQAQQGFDASGLPVTTLSLRRYERNYDVGKPDSGDPAAVS